MYRYRPIRALALRSKTPVGSKESRRT
uniref:Uncharacterized protein n=1 Tax=Anguilla anguilla TaxID=7936 RepID=A0A0E9UUA2_ANGAN